MVRKSRAPVWQRYYLTLLAGLFSWVPFLAETGIVGYYRARCHPITADSRSGLVCDSRAILGGSRVDRLEALSVVDAVSGLGNRPLGRDRSFLDYLTLRKKSGAVQSFDLSDHFNCVDGYLWSLYRSHLG